MSLAQRRRMAQLKKLAEPLFKDAERKTIRLQSELLDRAIADAQVHAASFSLIARFGTPQIGEPLSEAWSRCCADAPGLSAVRGDAKFNPFDHPFYARMIANHFTCIVLPHLPGVDEPDKLGRIFESAPPWLIRFTRADTTALLLRLNVPDLSEMLKYKRTKEYFTNKWPLLPSGVFETVQYTDAEADELMRSEDQFLAEHPDYYEVSFMDMLENKYARFKR